LLLIHTSRRFRFNAKGIPLTEFYALLCRTVNRFDVAQCTVMSKAIRTQLQAFGANVRRLRNERGITQDKLAELADLNIRTVQKIEAGQTNILITTAARIQKALACDWAKLMASI
jgi:DNA-binding XRE family transcriptional regulator